VSGKHPFWKLARGLQLLVVGVVVVVVACQGKKARKKD
jgi:hypothetical protein